MDAGDRKMFAPLLRGEARSPEAQVCAVLGGYQPGATAARLADQLLRLGYVVGLKASVTRRIEGLLEELERAARVERIPDGRYRVVTAKRGRTIGGA
jgi:hypothetical protein